MSEKRARLLADASAGSNSTNNNGNNGNGDANSSSMNSSSSSASDWEYNCYADVSPIYQSRIPFWVSDEICVSVSLCVIYLSASPPLLCSFHCQPVSPFDFHIIPHCFWLSYAPINKLSMQFTLPNSKISRFGDESSLGMQMVCGPLINDMFMCVILCSVRARKEGDILNSTLVSSCWIFYEWLIP